MAPPDDKYLEWLKEAVEKMDGKLDKVLDEGQSRDKKISKLFHENNERSKEIKALQAAQALHASKHEDDPWIANTQAYLWKHKGRFVTLLLVLLAAAVPAAYPFVQELLKAWP